MGLKYKNREVPEWRRVASAPLDNGTVRVTARCPSRVSFARREDKDGHRSDEERVRNPRGRVGEEGGEREREIVRVREREREKETGRRRKSREITGKLER